MFHNFLAPCDKTYSDRIFRFYVNVSLSKAFQARDFFSYTFANSQPFSSFLIFPKPLSKHFQESITFATFLRLYVMKGAISPGVGNT